MNIRRLLTQHLDWKIFKAIVDIIWLIVKMSYRIVVALQNSSKQTNIYVNRCSFKSVSWQSWALTPFQDCLNCRASCDSRSAVARSKWSHFVDERAPSAAWTRTNRNRPVCRGSDVCPLLCWASRSSSSSSSRKSSSDTTQRRDSASRVDSFDPLVEALALPSFSFIDFVSLNFSLSLFLTLLSLLLPLVLSLYYMFIFFVFISVSQTICVYI